MITEQEKAGWRNAWPDDSEQCPDCGYGLIETQEFGKGANLEIQAWCVGINGVKQEDAEEDDEDGCGCGWCGIYHPNASGQPKI